MGIPGSNEMNWIWTAKYIRRFYKLSARLTAILLMLRVTKEMQQTTTFGTKILQRCQTDLTSRGTGNLAFI